jgi:apolipoprotein N-acyltransferase
VIIWPESSVTFFLAREPGYRASIARLLAQTGADLLAGAPHYEDDDPARPRYYNSAFYLTADGHIAQRYDKAHLMPFGEYFPLRTIEFLRRRFERVRYFTPGEGTTLLDTRLGKTAVVICFEAMFPELVRERMRHGAEVLVNLSNDAWLGDNAGPRQHGEMVILRAVENRTWVIRATTTGVSSVIDPYGRVRAQTPLLQQAVLDASIVPLRIDTPYRRFGDAFASGCIVVSAAAMLWLARRGPLAPDRRRREAVQLDAQSFRTVQRSAQSVPV